MDERTDSDINAGINPMPKTDIIGEVNKALNGDDQAGTIKNDIINPTNKSLVMGFCSYGSRRLGLSSDSLSCVFSEPGDSSVVILLFRLMIMTTYFLPSYRLSVGQNYFILLRKVPQRATIAVLSCGSSLCSIRGFSE